MNLLADLNFSATIHAAGERIPVEYSSSIRYKVQQH
ncbi:MAG: hypothetical protein UZ13_03058 [Chloroflexi bacterium OLB13]|nr:MAG: hypothetical protein UZ13_03058 [Chloroflexi bacterium OLB13]